MAAAVCMEGAWLLQPLPRPWSSLLDNLGLDTPRSSTGLPRRLIRLGHNSCLLQEKTILIHTSRYVHKIFRYRHNIGESRGVQHVRVNDICINHRKTRTYHTMLVKAGVWLMLGGTLLSIASTPSNNSGTIWWRCSPLPAFRSFSHRKCRMWMTSSSTAWFLSAEGADVKSASSSSATCSLYSRQKMSNTYRRRSHEWLAACTHVAWALVISSVLESCVVLEDTNLISCFKITTTK